jgi:hypothetical protein
MANVKIDIAAEFTGNKAFKQAETSSQKLEKSVSNLGKKLAGVFAASSLIAFGKASIKAFAADEKAARSLALALTNTGNSFAAIEVEKFIADLQRTTGVLDDNLRPAFRTLLTATSDVKKSQDGLALALDISAGTGKDLSSVSAALAKGFSGQTTALSRLGAGLSKATLASGDMDAIIAELTAKFKGQALSAAQGYSGQMDLLTVASNNAKEIIGKDLLDSMQLIAGEKGIGGATTAIEGFATEIGNAIYGVSTLITKLDNLPGALVSIGDFLKAAGQVSGISLLAKFGASSKAASAGTPAQSPGERLKIDAAYLAQLAAQKKIQDDAKKAADKLLAAEKARLANLKKIAAEQQKKLALDQASALLNQAQKLFDIDRIQLAAAAMNKQSEEDKVRIRLKTEILDLEEAINSGNLEGAAKLAQSVYNDAKLLGELRGTMVSLGDVPDPFKAWLSTLQQMLATLLAMTTVIPIITQLIGLGGFNAGSARLGESAGNAAAGLPANSLTDFMGFGDTHLGQLARQGANATTINYNISASGIGDQQIASVVQNAIQDLNRYGNSTTYAGAI